MKALIKYFSAICLITIFQSAQAQNAEMADSFRAEGKIYVVVAIVLIVLVGLVAYLFLLDRKMNKLEKMIGAKKQTKHEGKSF
jgi:CcmD family protein